MKMNKKKVLVAALAVALVAILSVGTLAWFTASDSVVNYFQVSTDDETQLPDFKLDLFEHEFNGEELNPNVEVEQNYYKGIAPGDVLPKDPTVRNDGQYDQWVRVTIDLVNYDKWEAVLGKGFDFSKYFVDFNSDWVVDTDTIGTDTMVFYLNKKLPAGKESNIFGAFAIPSQFTVENMPTEFKMGIVAEAIQADNTGDSAEYAFANYWN